MTRRADIIWLDITSDTKEIRACIRKYPGIQYFPVCAGRIDTVIGILTVRDYLQACIDDAVPNLQKLLSKPLFIPESLTIVRALSLLKEYTVQAACIIDEYGGIEGFITKNGLVTTLLKEHIDTRKETYAGILKQKNGSIILSAQMSLDELQSLELFEDIERAEDEDYYTLAGYLLTFTDAIPQEGDVIDTGTYLCTVISMNGQRIVKVSVRRKQPS